MFGFGIKSKAKRIIREEFFYDVSYVYEPTFNAICQQGKMLGQNEYSIAIYYMTVMMNVLVENRKEWGGSEKDFQETEDFINKHSQTINRIIHQANSPESEIRNTLEEVKKNFSELKESSKKVSSEVSENLGNIKSSEEEESEENIFEMKDEDQEKLKSTLKPFHASSIVSKLNLSSTDLTEDQIQKILSIQLMGAMDYIGQSMDWSMEQLLVPFMTELKEDPYNISLENSGKLIAFINSQDSDVISLQISGANTFSQIQELLSKGKEAFSVGMMKLGRNNSEEILKLISNDFLIKLDNII